MLHGVLIRSAQTDGTGDKAAVKLAGQQRSRTIWYNGDIKKNPRQRSFDLIQTYLNYIRPKDLFDKAVRMN